MRADVVLLEMNFRARRNKGKYDEHLIHVALRIDSVPTVWANILKEGRADTHWFTLMAPHIT